MGTARASFPVVLGLLFAFALIGGIAQASKRPAKSNSLDPQIRYVDIEASGYETGEDLSNTYSLYITEITLYLPLVFKSPSSNLQLGDACSLDSECISGNCVDNVCCDTSCTGLCYACVASKTGGVDGVCDYITVGTDPDEDCLDPYVCNGAGSCSLPLGEVCVTGTQCISGNCADNVCCDTSCSALCEACVASKTGGYDGICSFIPAGTDPDDECPGSSSCDGSGACGSLPLGETCVSGTQCQSGYCIDGVCCNTSCSALCEACVATKTGGYDGICSLIPAGTDPDDECPGLFFCNGSGACSGP